MFIHPKLEDVELSNVLRALGDPVRLSLVHKLAGGEVMNCAQLTNRFEDLPISTRHNHLRVLRESGIIKSTQAGTSVMNSLRREDLENRFPGLLTAILRNI